MKEEDAYRWFMRARWHDNKGEPYCPACGNLDVRSIRRKCFRCTAAECGREFSVTSGTIFANRKLSFRTLVMAIAAEREQMKLQDVVEMDGMYVGGHVRPANRAEDRVDRRLTENQTGNRMAIIAFASAARATARWPPRQRRSGVMWPGIW
jgi:transposase-like protein